jgi:hypothetical protein
MAYYLLRNDELAVNEEVTYGTSPGNPAGADYFKHTSAHVNITPDTEEAWRDRDRDGNQASVLENYTGRASRQVKIECDLVPSGVSGTPTAPDADLLFKNAIGSRVTRTAHTTLTAASTTTLLNFTAWRRRGVGHGGRRPDRRRRLGRLRRRGAARREHRDRRRHVDRALSAAPASGRSVYVGTKFTPSEADLASLHLWLFNINQLRYEVPGLVLNEFGIACNFADGVPMVKAASPASRSRKSRTPSPARRRSPRARPSCRASGRSGSARSSTRSSTAAITFKNGKDLRNNESDALAPSAVKRTGNGSRYTCEQTIQLLATEGASGTQQFFDGGKTRTAIDSIVQLGVAPGRMVAWTTRNWRPRGERTEIDGEVGFRLTGRALGTAGDDEINLTIF